MRKRVSPMRALLIAAILLTATITADAEPAPARHPSFAPDQIVAQLNEALAWYRNATRTMRSVDGVASDLFRRQDEQTALRILQRAFDAARAQAALATGAAETPEVGPSVPPSNQADGRAKLEAAIQQDEAGVGRLREQVRVAPARERAARERQLAARSDELELKRARLEFLSRLQEFNTSLPDSQSGLTGQIKGLEDSVPELGTSSVPPAPPRAAARSTVSGTGGVLRRLFALQQDRRSLKELAAATTRLGRAIEEELRATQTSLRPVTARLHALAANPEAGGASLADSQREFHGRLQQAKQLGAVVLPLREESTLAGRYSTDLHEWSAALNREAGELLQTLAVQLAGVALAFAAIFVGAVLWRVAAVRYIVDPSRRRLVLIARSVVVTVAVVLILIFRFTSELAALVTVLGFAAAGIAFALQAVILALVGYFSIIGPRGIRVNDRIGLQGPFGYVHGEVVEIGPLRIKLRELAGEPGDLQPTGRVVVFPNSAIFTGSFFKHPPHAASTPGRTAGSPPEGVRPPRPQAAA